MARTVVAVYESVYVAKKAIGEMLEAGFPRDRIDLFIDHSLDDLNNSSKPIAARSEMVIDELRAGASVGTGIGSSIGIAGSLMFIRGVLHLPWLTSFGQPVDTMVVALVLIGLCAMAGAITGFLLGGLLGLGITEEEICQYARNIRKNGVTVMVVADWDAVDGTLEILGRFNPLEIRQKSIEWHKAGQREKKLAERALKVKVPEQNRPR